MDFRSEREVEVNLLAPLFKDILGYPAKDLEWARAVKMPMGRSVLTKQADLVVTRGNKPLITVEAKRPTESVQSALDQVDSYAFALKTPYSVITNGKHLVLRGYYSFNSRINVIDDSVDDFFPLYAENVRDHGTPALGKKYFQALVKSFGEDCDILTIRAADGRPVSTIMSFYFRDQVLAYYAGEHSTARNTAANDLKYWALMQRAAVRGCKKFDLGRSKKGTGSFEFKRLWEFQSHPLHYEYVLLKRDQIPQNNPMNPKYRLFIWLWQHFPIPVANALGPMIVRNLG